MSIERSSPIRRNLQQLKQSMVGFHPILRMTKYSIIIISRKCSKQFVSMRMAGYLSL
jgi:hypothetical protein